MLVALGSAAWSQVARSPSLDGVWSRDLDTCSLTTDEDELRLTVEGSQITDYRETCQLGERSARQDGSVLVPMSCGARGPTRTMRVFPTGPDRAIFYFPESKRPRSRDVIRCPPALPEIATPLAEGEEREIKVREPRRLIRMWLDARQRCKTQVSLAREEACAERRQIGAMLRAMRLCHVTRGSREGWRACS